VSIECEDEEVEATRARSTRTVGAEPKATAADRGSTADGVGDSDTRGGSGVCPIGASGIAVGLGGGMAERGTRTVAAVAKFDGIGVGRRKPGTGVGLRFVGGGCGDAVCSALGGIVDERFDAVDGGDGVKRFSGGGIVDLRDEVGTAEGGKGVARFSEGGTVDDLRDEAGRTLALATPASSSATSDPSAFRGSEAAIFVEERRDEPRAAFCDGGASGDVFPIVTTLTLIHVSQRVIPSLTKSPFLTSRNNHGDPVTIPIY